MHGVVTESDESGGERRFFGFEWDQEHNICTVWQTGFTIRFR